MADGLLNKASIILTPTGYKAGTLYNVAPVVEPYEDFDFARASVASRVNSSGLVEMVGRTLGSELVTNGDFATDSDWNLGTGWSIGDGKASFNGGSDANIIQTNSDITIGNTFKITLDVSDMDNGELSVRLGGGASTEIARIQDNGSYVFYGVSISSNITFRALSSFNGSIDNVSVKEIIDTNNIPRISYDSNGDNGHILLEPTSTNLVPYSENFEGGSWTNASVGTTPTLDGGYTAPDGSNSAYKISNANQDSFWYYPSVADSDYSRTIWARTVSGTGTAQLTSHNSNTNNTFNLTETWQRFEVNSTTSSTGETGFYAVDFRGSGTLDEVLVWGAQVENLSYATSYIPTLTGSTVTRATETATGAGSAELINSTEGVLYAEIAALADDATNRCISLSDGTADDRVTLLFGTSSNRIRAIVKSNGSTSFDEEYTVTSTLDYHKVAIKFKANDFALWIDGVERFSDTSGSAPIGLSELAFDTGISLFNFYGKCKSLAVFNEALSDSELNNLTG